MKLPNNRLRMTSGQIRKFKSALARKKFEKYVNAIKHGWKPTGKK